MSQPNDPYEHRQYLQQPALQGRSWVRRHKFLTSLIAFGVVAGMGGILQATGQDKPQAVPAPTVTVTPTASAKATIKASAAAATASTPVSTVIVSSAAAARKLSFPPTTSAAFRAFAATGDASQVHEVASVSEGLPSCPQPTRDVTVSPAVTGRPLEADLSAYFVQNGLIGNQCGAAVFVYHSMSDYQANKDNGFTAGRVILSNNSGSSPQFNLEVDTGSATNTLATFNFNF